MEWRFALDLVILFFAAVFVTHVLVRTASKAFFKSKLEFTYALMQEPVAKTEEPSDKVE